MKIKFINRETSQTIFIENDDGTLENINDEKIKEEYESKKKPKKSTKKKG